MIKYQKANNKELQQLINEFKNKHNSSVPDKVSAPPTTPEKISYDHCNVEASTDRLTRCPIFFVENEEPELNQFGDFPNPSDVVREMNENYLYSLDLYHEKPNYIEQTAMITNEFMQIIKTNVYAVFYNGLYEFIKPYCTKSREEIANEFNLAVTELLTRSLMNDLIDYSRDNEPIAFISRESLVFANLLGNAYYNFINRIMIKEFVAIEPMMKYFADIQNIPFDKISPMQYYMLVSGCLLEIASNDIHKEIEIIEACAFRAIYTQINNVVKLMPDNLV